MKEKFNWYPIDTSTVFATTNSGPWYKGGMWANDIDPLPADHKATVIKEILDAVSNGRPYTTLRPAHPAEGMGQPRCMSIVGHDIKKPGDMQFCDQPVSHVRYWVEGNHYMGRSGYCAKHVSEQHGSDPMRMHAVGQSKPVIGTAGRPMPKKKA